MPTIDAYRSAQVQHAPPEQILLLLLERAVKDQSAALDAMERGARLTWIAQINHARSIFIELQSALDHTLSPQLSRHLHEVYGWALHHLARSAREGDPELLRAVQKVTLSLHEAWTAAIEQSYADAEEIVANVDVSAPLPSAIPATP